MLKKDIYDYSVSALGIAWSAEQLHTILGIILLVLSIINILYKSITNVIQHIKEKHYKEAIKECGDTIDKIGQMIEKQKEMIKEQKEENDND